MQASGLLGAAEESSIDQAHMLFDVNSLNALVVSHRSCRRLQTCRFSVEARSQFNWFNGPERVTIRTHVVSMPISV